ncbi:cadmium resistance transporter [Mesorhizobium sp. AR02]|uniref:cadmium resistance transporter n=1 Tax=Mesorhizobium sp. AR02 TaxID=2865837 RepID=UPI00215EF9F2|nr:cadmium resistance transporter [Mesorhizobium sp. AR02]UVK51528.1 cadmium resistance transporter [Mesorhizobium sp. AR02]
MLSTIGAAIALFVATNIDDIFVLLGFFADRKFRASQVIIGQYLGVAALVAVSVLASLISLVVAPEYVGLLGLLPILIGLKRLYNLWKGEADDETDVPAAAGLGNILAVAAVTVANGGDNIGIYTPAFATSTSAEITIMVVVFAIMVAIWLAFSHWLVNHPSLGAPIRRYGHIAVPFVLIAIGILVLHEQNSLSLLQNLN